MTPRLALLIALTVPCRLASETVIFVVVVDELPEVKDSVIELELNLAVSEANALETLRCSLATWLTVMLFDPARADVVEVAVKADVWLLLTANVLKSLASFLLYKVFSQLFLII